MKIRTGFVSNSSSSSFVCEICSHSETGYDASPDDLGFAVCVNEHIFCEEHLLHTDCEREDYEYPEDCCPICQFIEYSQPELAQYLLEKYGVARDDVFAEIKQLNKRRKKLYNYEYIDYVFKKFNISDEEILKELKTKYGTYTNFLDRRELNED
jgi:hypothetical protein